MSTRAPAAVAAPIAPPPPPPPPVFVAPPLSDASPATSALQAVTGKGAGAAAVYGRCAWDDLLVGALPAWATLTIISTLAFLAGCLLTGLLARWRHNAAFYGEGAAARAADEEALPSPASEFVGGRRRPGAFKTPSTAAKKAAVRAAGVTGPLGVGAVVASMDGGGGGGGLPRAAQGGRRSSGAGSNGLPPLPAPLSATPAVRAAYEVEDLDGEWAALVAEVDGRLSSRRAKPCDARERAAVVRALLASGPAEAAEDALDRAARVVREGRGGRM